MEKQLPREECQHDTPCREERPDLLEALSAKNIFVKNTGKRPVLPLA